MRLLPGPGRAGGGGAGGGGHPRRLHLHGDAARRPRAAGGRAYEHGGLRGSGVAADLELETRFRLRFHLRDQTILAPCDDGAALAEAALGSQAGGFLQALLGSASNLIRSVVADERLQAPLAHWAAHSQQSPADPGGTTPSAVPAAPDREEQD